MGAMALSAAPWLYLGGPGYSPPSTLTPSHTSDTPEGTQHPEPQGEQTVLLPGCMQLSLALPSNWHWFLTLQPALCPLPPFCLTGHS